MKKLHWNSDTIMTHNGEITVVNTNTGNHRTFRIRTQSEDSNFAPCSRVLSVLTGSDNTNDYTGIGFVTGNANAPVRLWKKCDTELNRKYVNILIHPEKFEAKGVHFKFASRCRKCNRKLTDPTSIDLGIGPVCRGGA